MTAPYDYMFWGLPEGWTVERPFFREPGKAYILRDPDGNFAALKSMHFTPETARAYFFEHIAKVQGDKE